MPPSQRAAKSGALWAPKARAKVVKGAISLDRTVAGAAPLRIFSMSNS